MAAAPSGGQGQGAGSFPGCHEPFSLASLQPVPGPSTSPAPAPQRLLLQLLWSGPRTLLKPCTSHVVLLTSPGCQGPPGSSRQPPTTALHSLMPHSLAPQVIASYSTPQPVPGWARVAPWGGQGWSGAGLECVGHREAAGTGKLRAPGSCGHREAAVPCRLSARARGRRSLPRAVCSGSVPRGAGTTSKRAEPGRCLREGTGMLTVPPGAGHPRSHCRLLIARPTGWPAAHETTLLLMSVPKVCWHGD